MGEYAQRQGLQANHGLIQAPIRPAVALRVVQSGRHFADPRGLLHRVIPKLGYRASTKCGIRKRRRIKPVLTRLLSALVGG